MAKKTVSQSRTEWVEKGTIVNGRKVKKGYLAQKGKPEKKVTGRVALVTGQSSLGATSTYKKGRRVKPASAKKPATSTKSSSPASKTGSGPKGMLTLQRLALSVVGLLVVVTIAGTGSVGFR